MMNDTSSETLPVEAGPRQPEPGPGEDLRPIEREAAKLIAIDGLSSEKAAQQLGVSQRTLERYRSKPAWKRYANHLVSIAVEEAQRSIRGHFARHADSIAQRAVELALGKGRKGKPNHPYQDKFVAMALDRVAGKPGQSQQVGVKVPTERGDVVIVWRAKEE